jgi:hypothetical protein
MTPEVEEITKRAFVSLNLPHSVRVVGAVPGGPYRVLGLGALPPFVCDAAPVLDPTNFESVQKAMRWVLCAPEGDQSGYLVLDYLVSVFGPGVVELEPEDVEQKVRFA